MRAHTKTLLELWVMKTRELIESIDQETELLQKMMEMGGGELPPSAVAAPRPLFLVDQQMMQTGQ